MKLLLIFFFSMNLSFAAIPTVEGLFRDGGNPKWEDKTVIFSFFVTHSLKKREDYDSTDLEEDNISPKIERYCKLIITNTEDGYNLLQIDYNDISMGPNNVVMVKNLSNLLEIINQEPVIEKRIFYSLLLMFLKNDSRSIDKVLKDFNMDYLSNNDLLDKEKWDLLINYRDYLAAKKEDPEAELVSPMSPELAEEQELIKEVIGRRSYIESKQVSLLREEGQFFWSVNLENIKALFSNERQKIKKFSVNNYGKGIVFYFDEYILFDGTHELPKIIHLELGDSNLYQVRVLDIKTFNSKPGYVKRKEREFSKYKKRNEKNKVKSTTIEKVDVLDKTLFSFLYQ